MNKIKVFHVVSSFDLGGAERVALNIAKSKNQNFEYHLIEVRRGRGEFSEGFINELIDNNIIYHRSRFVKSKFSILIFPFWFIIKVFKYNPDFIHTHTEIPDLAIYLSSFIIKLFYVKIKFIRTIHNNKLWSNWGRVGYKVESFFKKNNSSIAISNSTRQSYLVKYGKANIPLIYNGVSQVNQEIFPHLKSNYINIIFAGRLEFQKGIEELMSIIKKCENLPNIFFHIVGKGSLRSKLLKEISNLDNFSFYDEIFNLSKYLGSFNYLFMPSNYEGLPLLSIEASLNGLIPIINNCDGLNETLPENWPLKVDNNCVEHYYDIFSSLKTVNHKKLQEDAFDFALNKFSIKSMQNNYEAHYLNIFNAK